MSFLSILSIDKTLLQLSGIIGYKSNVERLIISSATNSTVVHSF